MDRFHIHAIKAFDDNYIWVISKHQHAIIIDPGSADEVISYLTAHQLIPLAILITHHHQDHIGGVDTLMRMYKDCTLYAHSQHGIANAVLVDDGSEFDIMGLNFSVQMSAGHTDSHLSYLVSIDQVLRVFCGDTLFSGGCGRVFTGTIEQLYGSFERYLALPDDALFYPAHEYTLSNLKFAQSVCATPIKKTIDTAIINTQARLDNDGISLPTQLGYEKQINVFLHSFEPILRHEMAKNLNCADDALSVFAALRTAKNHA